MIKQVAEMVPKVPKKHKGLKNAFRNAALVICVRLCLLSIGAMQTSSQVINVVGLELGDAIQSLHEAGIEAEFKPEQSALSDIVLNQSIKDYDALPFETLVVHLYADDDSAIGAEIGFRFKSGAGFGLNEAFYNGMTFEISKGTYTVELAGAEITDSLYSIDEDGNIQCPRRTNTATLNFTHSGNYTMHIDW